MLFNSYEFINFFLPSLIFVSLVTIYIFKSKVLLKVLIVIFSLIFYGYWDYSGLYILLSSIVFNFIIGRRILNARDHIRKTILVLGIFFNLSLLAYYKYFNFIYQNISFLIFREGFSSEKVLLPEIILPLAISFFTFQQIAYLVDCYKNKKEQSLNYNLLDYTLFVTFFPQLIAGPIVHHRFIMPQYAILTEDRDSLLKNFSSGITLFSIGLLKKVIIADSLALNANHVFGAAAISSIDSVSAWIGAISYSLQIYFDFSAYCDMAMGLALLFGVRLPINFNSPYKAKSIICFWRRWHITLSNFLRDYLYIPLGGNRNGVFSRYKNIILTMLLGGLWHGAGWNFVFWGLLHGLLICLNHLWRESYLRKIFWEKCIQNNYSIPKLGKQGLSVVYNYSCWALTLFFLVITWVFFRSPELATSVNLLQSMFGLENMLNISDRLSSRSLLILPIGIIVCLFSPNLMEIFNLSKHNNSKLVWNLNIWWMFVGSVCFVISYFYIFDNSEFIYYRF